MIISELITTTLYGINFLRLYPCPRLNRFLINIGNLNIFELILPLIPYPFFIPNLSPL